MESNIEILWNNLRPINKETWPGSSFNIDPNEYRFDDLGAIIKKSEHGKNSNFGWNVDHILPVSKGGNNNIFNLQLLHWRNNEVKGDGFPFFTYEISRNSEEMKFENYSRLRARIKYSDEFISELRMIYPHITRYAC